MKDVVAYLRGAHPMPPKNKTARKTLLLWIGLVLVFFSVFMQTSSSRRSPVLPSTPVIQDWTAPLVFWFLGALVGGLLYRQYRLSVKRAEIQRRFNDHLQENEFEQAQELAAQQLNAADNERTWAEWHALLAHYAITRGDFDAAEKLTSQGLTALNATVTKQEPAAPDEVRALLFCARARALVAVGRAERSTEFIEIPPETPGVLWRSQHIVARALVLQATEQRDALSAWLHTNSSVIERELSFRDRWLLRVLEAWSAKKEPVRIPLAIGSWLRRAAPKASDLVASEVST